LVGIKNNVALREMSAILGGRGFCFLTIFSMNALLDTAE
jgi:hypothetical protein